MWGGSLGSGRSGWLGDGGYDSGEGEGGLPGSGGEREMWRGREEVGSAFSWKIQGGDWARGEKYIRLRSHVPTAHYLRALSEIRVTRFQGSSDCTVIVF